MTWQGALTALAIGILMGVVRERRHPPDAGQAGLRTHALVAVLGYVAWGLGIWPFMAILVMVGIGVLTGYRVTAAKDPGLTGEVAVWVTLVLSALVHQDATMAVGLGVLVATLLEFKQLTHWFTREWITEQELQDALVLAVASLVVMPLLPDAPIDPWNMLKPTTLWRIVVLVMAVGMFGHLAQRLLGVRLGVPMAGFFSGFVSSTAALVHLGRKAKADAAMIASASAAALLANLASLLLMMAIIGAVSPRLLLAVVWPFVAGCLGLLAAAWGCWHRSVPMALSSVKLTDRAFKLSHALGMAVLMVGVSLLSAASQALFGAAGVMASAVVVAIAELQTAAASVAQMSIATAMPLPLASWSLVAVLASSALAKAVLARFTGGPGFGWRVGAGLALMVAAAALTLLLQAA